MRLGPISIPPTPAKILAVVAPVGLPIAYLIYLKLYFAQRTTSTTSISPPDALLPDRTKEDNSRKLSALLPEQVLAAPDDHVVGRERIVSQPVPIVALTPEFRTLNKGVLETYLRTTMRAFTWTPQGLLMCRMTKDAAAKRTFSSEYLRNCRFEVGDRVCGVYVVSSRTLDPGKGEGRVVLDLLPPSGWKGPVVKGCLMVGFEMIGVVETAKKEDDRVVRIVNETVIWREKEEKPTWIESAVGRWLHGLMVAWMVERGLKALCRT